MGNEVKKKVHHVPFTQQTVDINFMPYTKGYALQLHQGGSM